MKKIRGFEKIILEKFEKTMKVPVCEYTLIEEYEQIKKPRRATLLSAGYDFYATREFTLEPGQSKTIPTGIKSYMQNDEWLSIRVRSGHGLKYNIRIKNQVGVVDADYYNNPKNEGHIFIALQNEGDKQFHIEKGEAFAQGIFHKYLVTDDDSPVKANRVGGFGSTTAK